MKFLQAGKELKNCLSGWRMFQNNVYGILKNNKYVAAVEIKGKVIIQAHTYRNGDISDDQNLKKRLTCGKTGI